MIRASTSADAVRNLDIWRAAVSATHDFLAREDFAAIEVMLAEHLPTLQPLVWVDEQNQPVGFMILKDGHIDALFVAPEAHGRGIGRALVDYAGRSGAVLTVDVNEQNPRAAGFYERLGFRTEGRSPVDDQGRPYPLLHMRRPA